MPKRNIPIEASELRPAAQIKIATESFERSAENVDTYATKYGYEPWRVRVMDAQRSSVHFVNLINKDPSELASATLLFQANGYSFSTAHNASWKDTKAKIVTPYSVLIDGEDIRPLRRRSAQLLYGEMPIHAFDSFRLFDIMSAVSLWYFERRDYDGTPLPEKIFVNPVLGCTLRCKSCSRLQFLNRTTEYSENLEKITAEISAQIENKDDLKVVNISTGALPTAEEDLEMFTAIIEAFRRKEFHAARFSIQTAALFTQTQLNKLRSIGVDRFSVTMDGTSDNVLKRLYKAKGPQTIDGYSKMIEVLEDTFPKVGIHMILGHDSMDTIKRTSERLASQGNAAVHHYIPRIFLPSQFAILHPEAINMGLEYYVAMKRFIDDLNDARMPKMDLLNPFYGLQPNEFSE
ncbi:radical SAM protein [Undibacterium fentianense]|uniref:Radical SAM protein n=1 Tax=Undibacterium fentianense TaxID=2828728 RepID=A0A941E3W4_9BURK|nr:radical SAM protein [Undibacterium fentianense]MBR7800114.1 radical SAM protein [Undibacterium fentianense]